MQCKHIKENNERCSARALKGGDYCFFHSPDMAQKRKDATSKGGKANKHAIARSLDPIDFNELRDIKTLLSESINMVRSGEMELNTAKTIGYLAGYLIKCTELTDVEGRLDRLEELVSTLRGEDNYN